MTTPTLDRGREEADPEDALPEPRDRGYGPSHGYRPGHGGPTGPGDAPAPTPSHERASDAPSDRDTPPDDAD